MIYSYLLDNNECYEDHDVVEILATEEVPFEEFQEIVKKAYELCGTWNSYTHIANKIVEIDNRFFFPTKKAIAWIGMEIDDYDDKIRGFKEINQDF